MRVFRPIVSAWRFVTARPGRLAVVGIAFFAGGIAAIPGADAGFNYTWRNAQFCDDCHIHDYANEGFFASAHADVTTCHDCHRVPIMHYPRNLWGTVVNGPLTMDEMHRPDVPTILCATCHTRDGDEEMTGPMTEDVLEHVVQIDDSPLHQLHMRTDRDSPPLSTGSVDDGISCMSCHGSETNRAHQFRPSRATCLQCHDQAAHAGGRLDELSCQECHFDGFTAPL